MGDTIYCHGDILTMVQDEAPDAVLVRDGKIAMLGETEKLSAAAGRHAEIVDLRGGCLMPAFIDAHSHITAFASTLGLAQLEGVDNFQAIGERMRQHREKNELLRREWLIGFGYDHNGMEEHRHPTREVLDRIAPEIPAMVTHKSGHMGVLNSAALRAAGITEDTPDPPGGKIGRDENGIPNGYLEEAAFIRASAVVPKPDARRQAKLLERAQQVYLRYGITTVQDGLTGPNELEMLRAGAQMGKLTLDVVSYVDMKKAPQLVDENKELVGQYHGRLKIGGYKLILDGSPQGKTAWLSQPYAEEQDGYCGYSVYSDEELIALIEKTQVERLQLLVHCNGDAASEQLLDCYARAQERTRQTGLRPVMIHAQTVRLDQLRRMAGIGMIPSFFVAHTYEWGDVHLANLGRERAERISPAHSAADLGLPFTFHQDTPVLPPDMLQTIWCATNRITKNGTVLGSAERVTVYEALRAVTINAAYQYFEEHSKGSIVVGKLADLVVLAQNPFKTAPQFVKDIAVLRTIKEGKTVYQK